MMEFPKNLNSPRRRPRIPCCSTSSSVGSSEGKESSSEPRRGRRTVGRRRRGLKMMNGSSSAVLLAFSSVISTSRTSLILLVLGLTSSILNNTKMIAVVSSYSFSISAPLYLSRHSNRGCPSASFIYDKCGEACGAPRSTSCLFLGSSAPEATSTPKSSPPSPAQPPITIQKMSAKDIERQIIKLGRSGKTDDALEFYQRLPRPNLRQFNAIIDACARARPLPRLSQAFQIFHENNILDNDSAKKLYPNVYTFGALMSACARSGDFDKALKLLNDMETVYGVVPNAVVYSTCISACARASEPRPDVAVQLLECASSDSSKIIMSVNGYNAAISAYANAGDVHGAMQLLEQMNSDDQKPNPDQVSYGTVLSACEHAGEWRLLMDIARDMKSTDIGLDGIALTSVLHACQQLGLAEQAIEYLKEMKGLEMMEQDSPQQGAYGRRKPLRGPDAVAYRLVISACARGGQWQSAIRILDEYCSKFDGGDVVAYTSAISGCEHDGEWKQAFVLLERMRSTGIQPNEVTFAAVIGACATATAKLINNNNNNNNGKSLLSSKSMPLPARKALQLLKVMKKDDTVVSPNTHVYNSAIRVCAEAGNIQQALQLLDELKAVSKMGDNNDSNDDDNGLEPTLVTYGTLMTACERVGSTETASRVFKMIRESGLEPNEIVYGAAISCCRKAHEPERCMGLLKKMIRENLKPNVGVFNTVLMAQSETSSSSLSSSPGNSNNNQKKSKKKGQQQQQEQQLPLTEQDLERCVLVYKLLNSKEYTGANPNRQTYSILIRIFANNGQPHQAEQFLNSMKQHRGLIPDVDLYTAVVSAYERSGKPLQAVRLMENMRNDGYDFYESAVLNAAFKRAVKIVNAVTSVGGSSGSSSRTSEDSMALSSAPVTEEDQEHSGGMV